MDDDDGDDGGEGGEGGEGDYRTPKPVSVTQEEQE